MQRATFTAFALLIPAVCSGQSLPPVTVDPAAAQHSMVRAAGMPLNDSGLPPGMMTVRVVRGAFTADLPGQTVTVDVVGGRSESARTGPDGRAQFAHLPIGAPVRVSAAVENQQLTSDTFSLPAESGVRLLLVLDDGSEPPTAASGTDTPFVHPDITQTTPPPANAAPATARGPSAGVLAIRIFFTIATLAAFAFVLFRQSAPRQRNVDHGTR